jgi:hypothetical protein
LARSDQLKCRVEKKLSESKKAFARHADLARIPTLPERETLSGERRIAPFFSGDEALSEQICRSAKIWPDKKVKVNLCPGGAKT